MIRHVVLFKFKSGYSWENPEVQQAERLATQVGAQVPDLCEWRVGRNVSTRAIAYDFLAEGLTEDMAALDRYLVHPFHQKAIQAWREISDWVVADVEQ